jgi:hypothetical protein
MAARDEAVEVEYRKVATRFEKYRSVETAEACGQMSAAMEQLKGKIQRLDLCTPDAHWKRGARADLDELLGKAARRSVETGAWFRSTRRTSARQFTRLRPQPNVLLWRKGCGHSSRR